MSFEDDRNTRRFRTSPIRASRAVQLAVASAVATAGAIGCGGSPSEADAGTAPVDAYISMDDASVVVMEDAAVVAMDATSEVDAHTIPSDGGDDDGGYPDGIRG